MQMSDASWSKAKLKVTVSQVDGRARNLMEVAEAANAIARRCRDTLERYERALQSANVHDSLSARKESQPDFVLCSVQRRSTVWTIAARIASGEKSNTQFVPQSLPPQ